MELRETVPPTKRKRQFPSAIFLFSVAERENPGHGGIWFSTLFPNSAIWTEVADGLTACFCSIVSPGGYAMKEKRERTPDDPEISIPHTPGNAPPRRYLLGAHRGPQIEAERVGVLLSRSLGNCVRRSNTIAFGNCVTRPGDLLAYARRGPDEVKADVRSGELARRFGVESVRRGF